LGAKGRLSGVGWMMQIFLVSDGTVHGG